jgi:FlaA1/EpsC-like NDP-sugar epimerase
MKNRDNITFFFIGDIIASVLSFIIAYFSRFFWLTNIVPVYYGVPHFSNYIKIYFIFLVIFPIIFYLNNFPRTRSKLDEVINIAVALFITVFLTFAVILYYRVYHQRAIDPAKALEPARIFIIYLFFISLILFSAIRLLIRKGIEIARKLGYQLQNVIIAGYSELSIPIAHILQSHKELGYNIVAFVDDAEPSTYQGIPVLNKLDNIVEYCQTLQVNTLITAFKSTEHEKLLKVLNATHNEMIEIKVVPDLLDYISLSTGIENLFGIPIINLNETPLKGINAVIKRIIFFMTIVIIYINIKKSNVIFFEVIPLS